MFLRVSVRHNLCVLTSMLSVSLTNMKSILTPCTPARVCFVYVLTVMGAGAWLELVWPTLLPERMRIAIPALWRAGGIIVLIAVALEWTWYRRRVGRLMQYQVTQRGDPGGNKKERSYEEEGHSVRPAIARSPDC